MLNLVFGERTTKAEKDRRTEKKSERKAQQTKLWSLGKSVHAEPRVRKQAEPLPERNRREIQKSRQCEREKNLQAQLKTAASAPVFTGSEKSEKEKRVGKWASKWAWISKFTGSWGCLLLFSSFRPFRLPDCLLLHRDYTFLQLQLISFFLCYVQ